MKPFAKIISGAMLILAGAAAGPSNSRYGFDLEHTPAARQKMYMQMLHGTLNRHSVRDRAAVVGETADGRVHILLKNPYTGEKRVWSPPKPTNNTQYQELLATIGEQVREQDIEHRAGKQVAPGLSRLYQRAMNLRHGKSREKVFGLRDRKIFNKGWLEDVRAGKMTTATAATTPRRELPGYDMRDEMLPDPAEPASPRARRFSHGNTRFTPYHADSSGSGSRVVIGNRTIPVPKGIYARKLDDPNMMEYQNEDRSRAISVNVNNTPEVIAAVRELSGDATFAAGVPIPAAASANPYADVKFSPVVGGGDIAASKSYAAQLWWKPPVYALYAQSRRQRGVDTASSLRGHPLSTVEENAPAPKPPTVAPAPVAP